MDQVHFQGVTFIVESMDVCRSFCRLPFPLILNEIRPLRIYLLTYRHSSLGSFLNLPI